MITNSDRDLRPNFGVNLKVGHDSTTYDNAYAESIINMNMVTEVFEPGARKRIEVYRNTISTCE